MIDEWSDVVGGRVLAFGSVVTSGLDAGVTYLAPLAGPGVGSVSTKLSATREEMLLRREHDVKMEMLAQVFLAAGTEIVS